MPAKFTDAAAEDLAARPGMSSKVMREFAVTMQRRAETTRQQSASAFERGHFADADRLEDLRFSADSIMVHAFAMATELEILEGLESPEVAA